MLVLETSVLPIKLHPYDSPVHYLMNKDIVNAYAVMNAATQPTTEPAITDMSTLTQCVAIGSRFANNTVTKLPITGINRTGSCPAIGKIVYATITILVTASPDNAVVQNGARSSCGISFWYTANVNPLMSSGMSINTSNTNRAARGKNRNLSICALLIVFSVIAMNRTGFEPVTL